MVNITNTGNGTSTDPCFMCGFNFSWSFPNMSNSATGLILVVAVMLLFCVIVGVTVCLCTRHKHDYLPLLKKRGRNPERDQENGSDDLEDSNK